MSEEDDSIFVPPKFADGFRIGRSAYGDIVLDAQTPEETMNWVTESLDSAFEGTVSPFCFPDENGT